MKSKIKKMIRKVLMTYHAHKHYAFYNNIYSMNKLTDCARGGVKWLGLKNGRF